MAKKKNEKKDNPNRGSVNIISSSLDALPRVKRFRRSQG